LIVPKRKPGQDEWSEFMTFMDLPCHNNVLPLLGICVDFQQLEFNAFCFVTEYQKSSLSDFFDAFYE